MNLLLISNSRAFGRGYLDHCEQEIQDFLRTKRSILFIPYAQPNGITYAEYAGVVRSRFAKMEVEVISIHEVKNSRLAIESAEALFVGGGNTFLLLKHIYDERLLDPIRLRAGNGMPYMGASAGSNLAGPTIMTTNDMPIVYPPSFTALNLVPFQINPHYLDPDPSSKHQGETREVRILEFLTQHDVPVVGLREGAMLRIEGPNLNLKGESGLRLFRQGKPPEEFSPGSSLNFLLQISFPFNR